MSDHVKPKQARPRRPKTGFNRTLNNNVKGYLPRRRLRGGRARLSTAQLSMTVRDQEDGPQLSPIPDDSPTGLKPQLQYSRDDLLLLRHHPLSILKHQCLDSSQNKTLVSLRNAARRRTDSLSLTDEDKSDSSADPQKKRMKYPKSGRLRKDQEVVLSPQRRSFNSGCFVNLQPQNSSETNRKPESPKKANRSENRSNKRPHDKEEPQHKSARYNKDMRKSEKTEPEEPEWFSGGPTSQHDVIELHGFDGPEEDSDCKESSPEKNDSDSSKKNPDEMSTESAEDPRPPPSVVAEKPVSPRKPSNQSSLVQDPDDTNNEDSEGVFNIDDFLNFDSLPPLLSTSNSCEEEAGSGSRFSQFFRRETSSPNKVQRTDSQHSSIGEMLNSIINEVSGIHSLEEVEARLRQHSGKPAETSNDSLNKEDELAAFRKLIMGKPGHESKPNINGNVNGGYQGQPPLSQLPWSHPLQQTLQNHQMPIPHDLVLKLLLVQQQQHQKQHQERQEFFAKLVGQQFTVPPPPSPEGYTTARDLLQRPEAQNILRGLKNGDITTLQLVEELKNSPHMSPMHRDILINIIKIQNLKSSVKAGQRGHFPAPSTNHLLHSQHQLRMPPPRQNGPAMGKANNFSVPPPMMPPHMDYVPIPPQFKNLQHNGGQHMMQRSNRQHPPPTNRPRGGAHMARGRNYNASPMGNHLSRWFSPQLLEQARAGQLPNMPHMQMRLPQAVHN